MDIFGRVRFGLLPSNGPPNGFAKGADPSLWRHRDRVLALQARQHDIGVGEARPRGGPARDNRRQQRMPGNRTHSVDEDELNPGGGKAGLR